MISCRGRNKIGLLCLFWRSTPWSLHIYKHYYVWAGPRTLPQKRPQCPAHPTLDIVPHHRRTPPLARLPHQHMPAAAPGSQTPVGHSITPWLSRGWERMLCSEGERRLDGDSKNIDEKRKHEDNGGQHVARVKELGITAILTVNIYSHARIAKYTRTWLSAMAVRQNKQWQLISTRYKQHKKVNNRKWNNSTINEKSNKMYSSRKRKYK